MNDEDIGFSDGDQNSNAREGQYNDKDRQNFQQSEGHTIMEYKYIQYFTFPLLRQIHPISNNYSTVNLHFL